MGYTANHHILKKYFNLNKDRIEVPGMDLKINNYNFFATDHVFYQENRVFQETEQTSLTYTSDRDIIENQQFNYPVFRNTKTNASDEVIILLHGLNERTWDKYLCWAYFLTVETGIPVLFFPIAFHMNRSPAIWHNPRIMNKLTEDRKTRYQHLAMASCANAALSERLGNIPERFMYSGFQSASDLVKLMKQIKTGNHPGLLPDTKIHLFGYSIGAFLSQILFIANPDHMLKDAKMMLFCGGSVFNSMNGISRLIMDSEAFQRIRSMYSHPENWSKTPRYFINILQDGAIGKAFRSMLSYEGLRIMRERIFRRFSCQINAIALLKDHIIPARDIQQTLRGDRNSIPVNVEQRDFPFPYKHETPFPIHSNPAISEQMDKHFDETFYSIAAFFSE